MQASPTPKHDKYDEVVVSNAFGKELFSAQNGSEAKS